LLVADQAWSRYSPVLRETLLNAVFARGQFFGLLEALETKGIPTNVLTLQRRDLLTKHKDPAISERAGKIFSPQLGTRTEALQRAKNALSLKPVPTHGREVFKQLCTTCHRLEREGVNVGPDLFDIRNQPKETILFHLVMPEAEVAPAFAPYVCETKSGRSIAGILSSETTTSITIRQPAGLQETVLRTELKSLHSLPGTLMPTGLDAAMTPQDIADLVAFLKGEG
jgi:putative heme-binding domain-containing protein